MQKKLDETTFINHLAIDFNSINYKVFTNHFWPLDLVAHGKTSFRERIKTYLAEESIRATWEGKSLVSTPERKSEYHRPESLMIRF